jgi:hypothetical protein
MLAGSLEPSLQRFYFLPFIPTTPDYMEGEAQEVRMVYCVISITSFYKGIE